MATWWSYLLITICLLYQLMPADADGNSPEGEVQCRRPSITSVGRISEYKEYYNKGEEITIRCDEGYYTSINTTRCDDPGGHQEWAPRIIQCSHLCLMPYGGILQVEPNKTFYDIGDKATLKCPVGYNNPYPSVQCVDYGSFNMWSNHPQCIDLCRKPDDPVMEMEPNKTFYDIGDTVTVKCPVGYRNLHPSVQCMQSGTSIGWNNPPECRNLCRKPDNPVMEMEPNKTFYDIGDTVTVKCAVGYRTLHPSVQCVNYLFVHGWSNSPQCRDLCRKPDDPLMEMEPNKTFYNIGDKVTVKCPVGYQNLHPSVQCEINGFLNDWNYPPECIDLCRKPDDPLMEMEPNKTFYDIGDTVTVKCPVGYQNPYPSVQCLNHRFYNLWSLLPECRALCRKPTLGNVSSFYVNKRHYNKGEWIAVQCKSGYYPTSEIMTCENPRSSQEWTPPTVTCIAPCKKPTIDNVNSLFMDKEYYKKGDRITIRCKYGYYPTSSSMTCNNPHASQEWIPSTATCIGVTFTDWRVTSISISFQFSCSPQCPDTWRFAVQLCPKPEHYYGLCKDSYGNGGIFTNLWPSSRYNIQTRLYTEKEEFNLVNKVIWTDASVSGYLEIIKVPSMEDKTIKWTRSEQRENIIGIQMNISAWRDYNVSFAVDQSLQFPPHVREYKIPLQYGTNYTITLQGFTTSGNEEFTTENIETDIGDPPLHMEKTMCDDTLQLYPVLNLNGPIRSYEIIVFGGQEGNSTKECLTFRTTPYNFIWSPGRYTAALLPAENLTGPRTFTLGDNQHYNGFHNAPLIPNHNYTIYIRVTSRWKHVETSACAFAGVIEGVTGSSMIPVVSGLSSGIMGLLVLILLALVCLIVVQFTQWMKQKLPRGKKRGKAENIFIQDIDQEMCENPAGAEDGIENGTISMYSVAESATRDHTLLVIGGNNTEGHIGED